jgi:hypothetical protein
MGWVLDLVEAPIAYLGVGCILARIRSKVIWRNSEETDSLTRDGTYWIFTLAHIFFWPLALVYIVVIYPIASWIKSPVSRQIERAEQLVEDAKNWDKVARTSKDEAQRSMALDLAKLCREQADTLHEYRQPNGRLDV